MKLKIRERFKLTRDNYSQYFIEKAKFILSWKISIFYIQLGKTSFIKIVARFTMV
ncbi:hypothetical protein XSR1_40118 [Xenorhabdus szentirmaii DSM 16338]|uniref:Uncharacterized protein n=1 Tax=Xenorhabdus szentirmaii DSM 16338 TaxID=1427518 RepID=W1J3Q6_9GAMM|nr:hypothetical protein XSR1_40118 [Xenorhabdus szentirmaii DSM 16338]